MGRPAPFAHVVGWGDTGPCVEDPRSIPELVLEAVEAALSHAGIGYDDIDSVVTASVDLFDGLTAANLAITEVVGAVLKPETRIAADGLCAAIHAACQVGAGAYETVLVVAHQKPSMAPWRALTPWCLDPILLQPLGVDADVCAALQACAAGAPAPVATVPMADRACAVVLRRTGDGPAIVGMGTDLDAHSLGDREDPAAWAGLGRATRRALDTGDIAAGAIRVAEASCRRPRERRLFLAATGLEHAALGIGTGPFTPIVDGLDALVRACERSAGGPALAHGTWGPAGQAHAIVVLEGAR